VSFTFEFGGATIGREANTDGQKNQENRSRSTFRNIFRPLGYREVLRNSKKGRSSFRKMTPAMTFYTFNQEMPSSAL